MQKVFEASVAHSQSSTQLSIDRLVERIESYRFAKTFAATVCTFLSSDRTAIKRRVLLQLSTILYIVCMYIIFSTDQYQAQYSGSSSASASASASSASHHHITLPPPHPYYQRQSRGSAGSIQRSVEVPPVPPVTRYSAGSIHSISSSEGSS